MIMMLKDFSKKLLQEDGINVINNVIFILSERFDVSTVTRNITEPLKKNNTI